MGLKMEGVYSSCGNQYLSIKHNSNFCLGGLERTFPHKRGLFSKLGGHLLTSSIFEWIIFIQRKLMTFLFQSKIPFSRISHVSLTNFTSFESPH